MKISQVVLYGALLSMASVSYANRAHHVKQAAAHPRVPVAQVVALRSVNINQANEQQLATVRGIGLKKAKMIVNYRVAHGAFKSVKDLIKVKGIGDKRLASFERYLTI